MSAFDRYMAVLSLYREDADVWSVHEIAAALGMPRSSVFRIVRDLVGASFLDRTATAHYRIGSAFPRLGLLARRTDPVVKAGSSLLRDVMLQARLPCIVLLSRLGNDAITCVAHRAAQDADFRWSQFEPHRPLPLTRGSSSQVILAQLTALQRRELMMKQDATAGSEAELDRNAELYARIRDRGYHVSHGEIDPALTGLAAPVYVAEMGIAASIGMIVEKNIMNEDLERRMVLLLVSSASRLTERLRRLEEVERQAAAFAFL